MMDFASLSPEKREEWRRQEITSMALAALREGEAMAALGVIRAAESHSSSQTISQNAGFRLGLEAAIDLLTREK